jgi:hypothetical protein
VADDPDPDPDAPPGAPANWLPQEPWVMSHWLPYDHRILLRELEVEFEDLRLLIAEHREVSLADVARERGVRPAGLLQKLMAPWRGKVSPRELRVLRDHARRTFTQPHLGSHFFGHIFHVGALNWYSERLYGLPIGEVSQLHSRGYSYYAIGEMNGRSRPELRRMVSSILRRAVRQGLKEDATPRAWTRFWLDYQRDRLDHYLSYGSREAQARVEPGAAAPVANAPASRAGAALSWSCWLHGRASR